MSHLNNSYLFGFPEISVLILLLANFLIEIMSIIDPKSRTYWTLSSMTVKFITSRKCLRSGSVDNQTSKFNSSDLRLTTTEKIYVDCIEGRFGRSPDVERLRCLVFGGHRVCGLFLCQTIPTGYIPSRQQFVGLDIGQRLPQLAIKPILTVVVTTVTTVSLLVLQLFPINSVFNFHWTHRLLEDFSISLFMKSLYILDVMTVCLSPMKLRLCPLWAHIGGIDALVVRIPRLETIKTTSEGLRSLPTLTKRPNESNSRLHCCALQSCYYSFISRSFKR